MEKLINTLNDINEEIRSNKKQANSLLKENKHKEVLIQEKIIQEAQSISKYINSNNEFLNLFDSKIEIDTITEKLNNREISFVEAQLVLYILNTIGKHELEKNKLNKKNAITESDELPGCSNENSRFLNKFIEFMNTKK